MECKKKNNRIIGLPCCFRSSGFHLAGKNNTVEFGRNVSIENCKIKVYGNASLKLGDNICLSGCSIVIRDSEVTIGSDSEALNTTITAVENSRMEIGPRSALTGEFDMRNKGVITAKRLWCTWPPLIAANNGSIIFGDSGTADSIIYNSDFHPLYDFEGNLLNPNKDVIIGDHVWIGRKCFILKGAVLGEGCVLAGGSVVSKEIPPHAVAAGYPARIVNHDVVWAVDKTPEVEAMFPITAEKTPDFYAKAYKFSPSLKPGKGCRLPIWFRFKLSLLRSK